LGDADRLTDIATAGDWGI